MSLVRLLRIKFLVIIFTALLSITIANILSGYLFLAGDLEKKKIIIIKSGTSIHQIATILEQEKIIKYRSLFEIIAQIYSYYSPLKSGEYSFTTKTTPYQVIRKLSIGKSIVHHLFIPEGYTVMEIIEKINAETRLDGKITSNIPEGYLMPSTYAYTYGDQREKIIDIMRQEMSTTLDEIMPKLPIDSPLKTRQDVLIMASIIEKEAGNNEERSTVAAVFINRLNKKMKLQADPTTSYAITQGKYKLERKLTRNDLKLKSPYNTYYVYGLPAGAISCPSKASLEAAISPKKTNALYFVVDGKGGHYFSSTLKEHNNYVQQFRRRVKLQNISAKN